jgi:hypothetical protein
MKKILVGGLLLLIVTILGLLLADTLGLPFSGILFTGGVGVVLGLVKGGGPIARIVGFVIGFLLAWVAFGVQAAILPQTVGSQILSSGLVIVIVTLIAGLSRDRVPFWSLLLGTAAMVGAYQTSFENAPQNFLSESLVSANGTLFGVAVGLIVAGFMNLIEEEIPDTDSASTPKPPAKSDNSDVLSV